MAEITYPPVIALTRTVFRGLGLRFTISGEEHVPRTGGAVMAINHVGYLDFTFAGLAARPAGRLVRFMAKKEVFDHKVSGPLMRGMKHIPVDRQGAAGDSYRSAVTALQAGEIVGVFPEATISQSFELKEFKTGAVRMAQEAGVPLLPCIVWGSQRVMTKGRPKDLTRGTADPHRRRRAVRRRPGRRPARGHRGPQGPDAGAAAAGPRTATTAPRARPRTPGGSRRRWAAPPRRSRRPPRWPRRRPPSAPSAGRARPADPPILDRMALTKRSAKAAPAAKGKPAAKAKGGAKKPKQPRGARLKQIRTAFTMTRQRDPKVVPLVLAALLGPIVLLVLLGLVLGGLPFLVPFGILLGVVLAALVFGRRVQATAYAQVEGQPGAAAAVLSNMRGDWRVQPAVGFTREQDLVHRVIGRPGVVLVAEGSPHRTRGLLSTEKKKVTRIVGSTPVYEVVVGDAEGQVPLRQLERHFLKLPRNVKGKTVNELDRKFTAMGQSALPIPKGPVPTRVPRR